jgi:ribosome-interacting GTPase 1
VVVVGAPNAGKTAIVRALTGNDLEVAPYPFTTREPHPALMPFENAHVQLVDLPPVSAEHIDPWLPGIVRAGEAALLCIDLAAPDLLESTEAIFGRFRDQKIHFGPVPEGESETIGAMSKRTLLAANKSDTDGAADALEIFRDLSGSTLPAVPVSAETGAGIEDLRIAIWRLLDVVRAIPKPPGKPPDQDEPIILPRGSTVLDVARVIHRELADRFKRARVWNSPDHAEGQWVSRDHVVQDLEVFELEV